ncbi:uncharacterized protein DUF2865 [Roseiarcus fermentans]|uniref:Uncharacterized protein DUF2865 n=1 Tax=Roseiarcus fermentans TaxID=1473586 RepID=A0A366FN62_9HYPH|nr:DUF2865 domain-containing protein [Roseiarcus fermentans]RBP16134.1 uncharacterized protein DUF2865 [Roseiarcus fermentans]
MAEHQNARGSRKSSAVRLAIAAFATAAGLLTATTAYAESTECARLRAAIASARGDGQASAAASRQRAELARTNAYANSIGCSNQKFLFFGSEPPPQCGEIKGQIARLQASVSDLEGRAGGGRGALVARYNSECADAPQQPRNFFEALFGGGAKPQDPYQPINPETLSPDQQQQTIEKSIDKEKKTANVSAGSYAVCVRTCDGSFFPVSYSGAGGRLEDVCRSLCPNADVQLYSFPFGGTIEQAVSLAGQRYVDMPNALKFQQTFDPTCSCRRKGESWAQALAAAEAKYGHEAKDILVTPEKSIELSRPIVSKASVDAKAKLSKGGKPAPATLDANPAVDSGAAGAPSDSQSLTDAGQRLNANGENAALSAAAATVSRETSGIAGGTGRSGGAFYSETQGQTVTQTGPDGVKTKVRVVGPSL